MVPFEWEALRRSARWWVPTVASAVVALYVGRFWATFEKVVATVPLSMRVAVVAAACALVTGYALRGRFQAAKEKVKVVLRHATTALVAIAAFVIVAILFPSVDGGGPRVCNDDHLAIEVPEEAVLAFYGDGSVYFTWQLGVRATRGELEILRVYTTNCDGHQLLQLRQAGDFFERISLEHDELKALHLHPPLEAGELRRQLMRDGWACLRDDKELRVKVKIVYTTDKLHERELWSRPFRVRAVDVGESRDVRSQEIP